MSDNKPSGYHVRLRRLGTALLWLLVSPIILSVLIAFLIGGFGLYVYLFPDQPPSATERIADTSDGILNLFEQECFKLRNEAWARRKAREYVESCNGFFVIDGRERCLERATTPGWQVQTKSGKQIDVSLSMPYGFPAPHTIFEPAWCSIVVRSKLDPALKEKVEGLIAQGDSWKDTGLEEGDDGDWWMLEYEPPRE
jgi:hypothetical protein